jgi:sugar O-acyltransferase (sialic acid O-acetyltransferase NeuD family)
VIQAPVIVVGAGGHAVVVADALLAAGRTGLGFVDCDPVKIGQVFLGLPVLGDDEVLQAHLGRGIELANGIGGLGSVSSAEQGTLRRRVHQRLSELGWTFAAVRHPGAVVSTAAELSPGSQVLAGAVVQPCAQVGVGAIINSCALVEHHAQVGAFAHIAPGAVLCGDVQIGEETHVGAGAVVRQGLHLAARVVVAAGAAVVRDVRSGVVAGVPARAKQGRSRSIA